MDPWIPPVAAPTAAVAYECGNCGAETTLRPKEPIRCQQCGHRVLYKKRAKRGTLHVALCSLCMPLDFTDPVPVGTPRAASSPSLTARAVSKLHRHERPTQPPDPPRFFASPSPRVVLFPLCRLPPTALRSTLHASPGPHRAAPPVQSSSSRHGSLPVCKRALSTSEQTTQQHTPAYLFN